MGHGSGAARRPRNGRRQSLLRVTALLVLGPSLSACDPSECRYETRFVATTGSGTSDGIGTIVAEFVNFRQYSTAEPPSSLAWTIAAIQTENPAAALSLRDGRDTTEIVAVLPIGVPGTALSAGGFEIATEAEGERLFDLLSSGNGVVLVHANGVAGALVIPLAVTTIEGWHRPSCD